MLMDIMMDVMQPFYKVGQTLGHELLFIRGDMAPT
jgi:hypothetical protein